jgi:uncharacterized protein YjiS (DUF1127 family)
MTSLPLTAGGFSTASRLPRWQNMFASSWATVQTWLARSRSRSALTELDEFMLKDIGLTRADVVMESSKPFWQR